MPVSRSSMPTMRVTNILDSLLSEIELFISVTILAGESTCWDNVRNKLRVIAINSDGVTEAENINKELYGEEKLLGMLSDNASSDVRTTVNVVVDSIASHVKEAEASDDLTILLIQYEPGTANS